MHLVSVDTGPRMCISRWLSQFWRDAENAKNAVHFPWSERLTISCACSTMAARWSALFRLSA